MSHANYIKTHIYSIPALIENHVDQVYDQVYMELPKDQLKMIKKIVITGCGYSYASGINAKYIFEKIAHIPTDAAFSIDASRHLNLSILPPKKETMFIGVSNSGIVARIAECMERFHEFGAITIALTGDQNSRCAQDADYILNLSSPNLKSTLPLRSYMMTLMTCYAIAWSIALAKGIVSESERIEFYKKIKKAAQQLTETLPQIEDQLNYFAGKVQNAKAYEFVGSGISYATAWLGRQEVIGQTGKTGMDCSLEDWLHCNFFWNNPERIGTMLFMPSNSNAISRIKEVQDAMIYLKRPLCVVTDQLEFVGKGSDPILLPYMKDELLNPIIELIPISLFAGRISELIGESYSRGFRDRWDFSEGGHAVEFSEIKIIN